MNLIVSRIDELRKRKGWSKYQLAEYTGLAKNTVYGWYRTGATPSLNNVLLVCEAMQISLEQFFCSDATYNLSEEENKLLQDWFLLSDVEKKAVFNIIEVFKILRR